eukprot:3399378-Pyramimonas_sp.AAC.1
MGIPSLQSGNFVDRGLSHRLDVTLQHARRGVARRPARAGARRGLLAEGEGDLQAVGEAAGGDSSARWKA